MDFGMVFGQAEEPYFITCIGAHWSDLARALVCQLGVHVF